MPSHVLNKFFQAHTDHKQLQTESFPCHNLFNIIGLPKSTLIRFTTADPMAEVLSPSVQSTSTITYLHSRPASADAFSGSQQYNQPSRLGQPMRSMQNGTGYGYRTASAPVQPYAFQSTPHLRQENRSISNTANKGPTVTHRTNLSVSTSSSNTSSQPSLPEEKPGVVRPAVTNSFTPQLPELSFTSFEPPAKASPDRYRRPAQRRTDSNSSNNFTRTPSPANGEAIVESASTETNLAEIRRQSSYDDIAISRTSSAEMAKRYRRRSLNQLNTSVAASEAQATAGAEQVAGQAYATSTPISIRPAALSTRDIEGSQVNGSIASTNLSQASEVFKTTDSATPRAESKAASVRGTSDGTKRLAAPSPLSRQTNDSPPASPAAVAMPRTYAAVARGAPPAISPAAQQLAAVSDKDLNKGMKSRLRRAFSFGSAQELRKVASENSQQTAQQTREAHHRQIDDELDAEQLEIARRQEAAGIGAGIYSGQGGFTGSTDNLSISSTASSASMMLRKMGRGAKKGARSVKGLFRPKSVIGVPAADGPYQASNGTLVEPSIGQVSMVTVEAERQNVNVNAHPDERTGGGTGFPKLERNSLDAATAAAPATELATRGSADTADSQSRRSIVGSDRDRAEVLAAVRKGILKRSGTASPSGSPIVQPSDQGLGPVPGITESPSSIAGGTPRDGMTPYRSSSAPVPNDYFNGRPGLGRSMPTTPNGSYRSISFSPRIQFHDAHSATDYDRRGEIATCNRLTPLLAQQIKEELNTFKMVGRCVVIQRKGRCANGSIGDGSTRTQQTTHALLLTTSSFTIAHPNRNDRLTTLHAHTRTFKAITTSAPTLYTDFYGVTRCFFGRWDVHVAFAYSARFPLSFALARFIGLSRLIIVTKVITLQASSSDCECREGRFRRSFV